MANGRNPKARGSGAGRISGRFIALPVVVMDCPNFQKLSANARSLLLEVARQFNLGNNGRLLISRAYLLKRGWNSNDMISKGKKELLEGGFIYETVKGHRPNKASWYAITWQDIDKLDGYDVGALKGFNKGAYNENQYIKNKIIKPQFGTNEAEITPYVGMSNPIVVPQNGVVIPNYKYSSAPQVGHHLELPSTVSIVKQ